MVLPRPLSSYSPTGLTDVRKTDGIKCRHIGVVSILSHRRIHFWEQDFAIIAWEAVDRVVDSSCVEGIQSSTGKTSIQRQIVARDDVWQDQVAKAKYLDRESANRGWIGGRRDNAVGNIIWPAEKFSCIKRIESINYELVASLT